MTFLRNAWYCVGFSADMPSQQVRAITVLGVSLVVFKNAAGEPAALADRCPHRFAPLSRGKCVDGVIQCGYHGLRFDAAGHCVHNPHAQGAIPKAASVKAFPMLERYGALWIWMGEAAKSDPALLPDFSLADERPGWSRIQGYLQVKANYQLIVDNLLDLSHVPFLHPFLSSDGPPPADFRPHINTETRGVSVYATNEFRHMPMTELYRMLWERDGVPETCELRANMRWDAPSLLWLDTGATVVDAPREEGPALPQAHWITPETEFTSHYFWTATRNRYQGNDSISAKLVAGIDGAFRNEDEPMIEAVQNTMGTSDLWSLRPVLLPTDSAGARARRILEKMIQSEHSPDHRVAVE